MTDSRTTEIVDDEQTPLVDFQVEDAVTAVVRGHEDDLVEDLSAFAAEYAQQVREDHRLFVDAFRAGKVLDVT